MRRCVFIGLLSLLCAGCSGAFTHFEHPIVAESGAAFDRALVGRWVPEDPAGQRAEDDESLSFDIDTEDAAGRVVITTQHPDKEPTIEEYRLVTAQLGELTIVSAQAKSDDDRSWKYFRYSFAAPDLLLISPDDHKFWADSVRNQMISGKIEKGQYGMNTTVTASEAELRTFVLGYGAVIFSGVDADGDGGRLRRVDPGE